MYDNSDIIIEEALDMAIDMSDRYGIAVEDAYGFTIRNAKDQCDRLREKMQRYHERYKIAYAQYIEASEEYELACAKLDKYKNKK